MTCRFYIDNRFSFIAFIISLEISGFYDKISWTLYPIMQFEIYSWGILVNINSNTNFIVRVPHKWIVLMVFVMVEKRILSRQLGIILIENSQYKYIDFIIKISCKLKYFFNSTLSVLQNANMQYKHQLYFLDSENWEKNRF